MGAKKSKPTSPLDERSASIAANLDANNEVALRAIVLETVTDELFGWRSAAGTNLVQEAARRGYRLVAEHLLQNGTAAQLQEEADAQGNYSTHLAAKHGHFLTAVLLAKGLPGELHLQANSDGVYTLSLALASLTVPYHPSRQLDLEELLSLYPSEVLAYAFARCKVEGKSPWQHLLETMDSQWLRIVLEHTREREEWKDILCLPDSEGKNVAHYVCHSGRAWMSSASYSRQGLRPPTFEEVLVCIPTEAFTMEDDQGMRPWQYFPGQYSHKRTSALSLERILAHTPIEGMFSVKETEEERVRIARRVLSAVTRDHHQRDVRESLRAILSRLPPTTADGGVDGDEPLLLKLLRIANIRGSPSVVMEFLTEEGFLAVTAEGESFVHLAVRGVHRLRAARASQEKAREGLLNELRTKAFEQVDCCRLLSMRCEQGLTAADLAEELDMPLLAQALRPTTTKAAVE